MKIAVIGAGAWGTALANLLCHNEHDVTLWGHNPDNIQRIRATGRNGSFLPGIELAKTLKVETDIAQAAADAECAVIAVPSAHFREVTSQLPDFSGIVVSVTKGIEFDTGLTMAGILQSTMPKADPAVLSGPSLALEVAREIPTALVAAHPNEAVARKLQNLFNRPNFRIYTSADVLGVEFGGALKNVVAIAAGVGDGLGFGDNSKASLITRAIVEIRRLGVACGAAAETFSGLSGLGDLTVTCFSRLSRNRQFGERLGRGEKVEEVVKSTTTVAEGYPTARSAHALAHRMKIQTPIIDEVHAMLYEQKNIHRAVQDLMSRDLKPEDQ